MTNMTNMTNMDTPPFDMQNLTNMNPGPPLFIVKITKNMKNIKKYAFQIGPTRCG
jgi:hypothetical protein